jgi:hypothetical protein
MAKVRYIDDDGDDVLKDGETLKVGLRIMDSQDAVQREVARDSQHGIWQPTRIVASDGRDGYALHKPGPRYADASDPEVRGNAVSRAEIYALYDAEKAAEYRGHPGGSYYRAGPGEWRGSQPGDVCTINGHADHLQIVGGELTCIPDHRTDAVRHNDGVCPHCNGSGIKPGARQTGLDLREQPARQ